jgi:hypothetical protein
MPPDERRFDLTKDQADAIMALKRALRKAGPVDEREDETAMEKEYGEQEEDAEAEVERGGTEAQPSPTAETTTPETADELHILPPSLLEIQPNALSPTSCFAVPHEDDHILLPLIHKVVVLLFASKATATASIRHPIIPFTILSNYRPGNQFTAPANVPPFCSRVLYVIRAAFFKAITDDHSTATNTLSLSNITKPLLKWVKLDAEGSEDSVFTYIRRLSGRISKVVRRTPGRASFIRCSPDGNTFEKDGHRMRLSDFSVMAMAMMGEIEKKAIGILEDVSFLPGELPTTAPKQDDPSKADPGYSMFTDEKNDLARYRTVSLNKLVSLEKYATVRVEDGVKKLVYNDGAWLELGRKIDDLTKLLLAAFHLYSGGVWRGSEVCIATYANLFTRLRHWCWVNGGGVNFSEYSKTSGATVAEQTIARAQNPTLSYILFHVLLIIRPVDIFISLKFKKCPITLVNEFAHTHLWFTQGVLLDSDDLSKILRLWTKRYLGHPCGIAIIRQIWTYGKDIWLKDFPELRDLGDFLEAQSSHSPETGNTHYGLRIDSRGSIFETTARTHLFISISKHFWKNFGIDEEARLVFYS